MRKNVLGIYFAARKNAILSMNLRPFLMKLLRDQPNSKFCENVITYHFSIEFKSNKFDSSLIFLYSFNIKHQNMRLMIIPIY